MDNLIKEYPYNINHTFFHDDISLDDSEDLIEVTKIVLDNLKCKKNEVASAAYWQYKESDLIDLVIEREKTYLDYKLNDTVINDIEKTIEKTLQFLKNLNNYFKKNLWDKSFEKYYLIDLIDSDIKIKIILQILFNNKDCAIYDHAIIDFEYHEAILDLILSNKHRSIDTLTIQGEIKDEQDLIKQIKYALKNLECNNIDETFNRYWDSKPKDLILNNFLKKQKQQKQALNPLDPIDDKDQKDKDSQIAKVKKFINMFFRIIKNLAK